MTESSQWDPTPWHTHRRPGRGVLNGHRSIRGSCGAPQNTITKSKRKNEREMTPKRFFRLPCCQRSLMPMEAQEHHNSSMTCPELISCATAQEMGQTMSWSIVSASESGTICASGALDRSLVSWPLRNQLRDSATSSWRPSTNRGKVRLEARLPMKWVYVIFAL